MKILRANKPEEGKTPIVIALSDFKFKTKRSL